MFDTMLSVVSVLTSAPSDDDLTAGASPEIIVSLVPGMAIPIADPSDPNRPLIIPSGHVRFRLDGESAVDLGEKLIAEGQRMPKRHRVEVATSMNAVEAAAQNLERLKG